MREIIDPKVFGLPKTTIIEKLGNDHVAIVVERKSRIIMSDGIKILEKANKIKKISPKSIISLKTTTSICNKTRKFLIGNEIDII